MVEETVLLNQIKLKSRCAYDHIYKAYYPSIEKFILSNSGSSEDAQDVFQETILILSNNVEKEDFELTSTLKTYLYSVSKNLWLKTLSKRKHITSFEASESSLADIKDFSEEEREDEKKVTSYIEKLLTKIPHHCQQMIHYVFYKNASPEKVAEELGYNNNHTVSNVKYKCIQQMKKASNEKKLTA